MLPLNGCEPGGHKEPASQPCAISSPMELSGVTENQIKTGGVQDMKVDGEGSDAKNDGSVERK